MTNSKSQMPNEEERRKAKSEKRKVEEGQEDVIARHEAIPLRKASEGQVSEDKEEQKELDNVKNQLVRALADYQNQNKRFQEERAQIFQYASQSVLENLIPVLDILEKAQMHVEDQGLGMAIGQFKKVLIDEGLEEIVPMSHNPFDHTTMEVVESVKVADPERPEGVEGKKDTVAEVVLNGWKFKDGKVVRFAKVKVFSGELKVQS